MNPSPIDRATSLSLIGAASAAALSHSAAAVAQTPLKVRVAGIPVDAGAACYFALDMGFYKKYGLDVDIVTMFNGSAIAASIVGGSLDVGVGNTVAIATAHEQGVPFVIVAPAGAYDAKVPTAGLLVQRSSPINSARDLVGKTIGVGGVRGINEIAVRAWLVKNGVDDSLVKFTEIPFPQQVPALSTGRVDGIATEEPFVTAILAKDGRMLATVNDAIGSVWVEGAYFCTRAFCDAHPDFAKRFADAMAETNTWANANHEANAKILGKYAKTDLDPRQKREFYPARLRADEIQPLIDASARFGVLKSSFPAKDLFAPGLA